jgi:MFS family permease
LPETVASSGKRLTFTPQVPKVPRVLWRTFGLSALGVLASWSVGGLYLSLGPSIADDLFGTSNHAVGGAFVFAFCAFAAAIQWVLRGAGNRLTLVGGATALAAGSLVTAAGVSTGSNVTFVGGSVLVGLGFGAAFMGALRSLAAKLPPAHRASVMSAFFVVAYAAISIPAIAAGIAAVHIGLTSAATWFGCAVAGVAALVAVIGWFELRPAAAEVTPLPRAEDVPQSLAS